MFQRELASIRKFGFVQPLIVRPDPLIEGRYQIIDGEHRWRAGKSLGMEVLPCFDIGPVNDDVAKELTLVLNELHGEPDPIKLKDLLADLLERHPAPELTQTLPYSETELVKLTSLPPFDWQEFERQIAEPTTGTGWVERMFRMPRESAEVLDQALGRVRESEGKIADWQALELIAADYLGGPR